VIRQSQPAGNGFSKRSARKGKSRMIAGIF
jgi:hypothetical protein